MDYKYINDTNVQIPFKNEVLNFKIYRLISQRMMSSLPDVLKRIEQVKIKKMAVKGNATEEKILAAELKDLNLQLRTLKESSTDDKKKYNLKVPKGTKDYSEKEMSIREDMFSKIISVFKRHGGVTIDTYVFLY